MQKPITITPIRTRDQARDALRTMIIEGEISAASRIEEVDLAERLGISRTPVREALIALETEGLVISRPNRGFRVAPLDRALVSEAFPIIGALEATALRLSRSALKAALPELENLIAKLAKARSGAVQYQLDHAFHERLTRDCGNARLLALLAVERNRARRFDGYVDRGTADREGTCRDHAAIVAAIREGDFEDAAQILIRHWDWGREVVTKWLAERGS